MPFAIGPRGTRLHYRVVGDRGPAVVLLQGIGLSSRFWFEQPELLANDAREPYRVLLVDNRGTGKSDAPRGLYRMRHMADDAAAAIEAADMAPAIVVGISMGGMIAQHLALRHPDKVSGLVLLATTMGLPHGRLPAPTAIATLVALGLKRPGASKGLARLLLPQRHVARRREILADWPAAFRESPTRPFGFLGQLSAVLAHSTGFRLRKITCPTVIVTGDDDILVPKKNSELLAKRIRGAALEIVPDAGHGLPLLDRDVVRRSLERLRSLPSVVP